MRKAMIIITALLMALLLPAAAKEAETACDKAVIAYRMPTDNPDAEECLALVTVGYVHGIDVGQTGKVTYRSKSRRSKKEIILEVIGTDAYLSICRLQGVKADQKLKDYSLELECHKWSAAERLEKATTAFEAGDWARAQFFYCVTDDSLSSDQIDLAGERMDQCAERLMEERNRELTNVEKESELLKKQLYHELAIHYLLRGDYAAAKIYNDRILRVAENDEPAKEVRALIYMNAESEQAQKGADEYAVCNLDNVLEGDPDYNPLDLYPEMIDQEQPEYPREARKAGVEGTVWVEALVDDKGQVRIVQVGKSSGSSALDLAAVKAAYGNKLKPAQQNGKPVPVWITYKVDFRILN